MFTFKILTKSLPVKVDINVSNDKSVLVVMEDASSSMGSNLGYTAIKALQTLLLKDSREIHYYRYAGQEVEFVSLNTIEDKLNYFSQKKEYYKSNCDYIHLFKEVLPKYKSGDVIVVTDGDDALPYKVNTNLSINFVDGSNRGNNLQMKKLCKITNGKYINLL